MLHVIPTLSFNPATTNIEHWCSLSKKSDRTKDTV